MSVPWARRDAPGFMLSSTGFPCITPRPKEYHAPIRFTERRAACSVRFAQPVSHGTRWGKVMLTPPRNPIHTARAVFESRRGTTNFNAVDSSTLCDIGRLCF